MVGEFCGADELVGKNALDNAFFRFAIEYLHLSNSRQPFCGSMQLDVSTTDLNAIRDDCLLCAFRVSVGQKTLSGAMDEVPKNSPGHGIPAVGDEPCRVSVYPAHTRWYDRIVGGANEHTSRQPNGWPSQRMLGLPMKHMEDDDRPKQLADNG